MSNNQKKQLTPVQQEYQDLEKQKETKRPVVKNCIKAFLQVASFALLAKPFNCFIFIILILQIKQPETQQ